MLRRIDVTAFVAALSMGTAALAQPAPQAQPRQTQPGQAQPRQAQPGQAQPGRGTGQTQAQPGRTTEGQELNAFVADCLILGNQGEVAISTFALDRIQDPQVKEFAQMLIEDHEKAAMQLRKFASRDRASQLQANTRAARRDSAVEADPNDPAAARRDAEEARQERETRDAANPANAATRPGTRAAAGTGSLTDQLYEISYQEAQECLAMTQEALEQKEADHFDKAFLGHQMVMHIGMIAKLKALEGNVSGELAQVVQQAEQTTQQHKEKAEQLLKQVSKEHKDHPRGTTDRDATPRDKTTREAQPRTNRDE